jgi:fermentation-respiration switch protein FrsA (DUF1100 family)
MEVVSMRLVQAVAFVVIAFLALAVLIRLFERSFIFFPLRYPAGVWDPALLGVDAEDVWFEAADGTRLHGWWIEAPVGADATGGGAGAGSPVLLWSHGNAGNLTHRAPHAAALSRQGLSVFLFDYRGYGRSEGGPSEAGLYLDTEAAYIHLTEERGIPTQRLILMGVSLGCAPTARLSTRVEHAGTILVSPFTSAKAMASRMFFGLPLGFLASAGFPVTTWVAERSRPLLVIHGEADTVVPFKFGQDVFAAAAEPKLFVSLPGTGHNDILQAGGAMYLDAMRDFAHRVVAAAGPS